MNGSLFLSQESRTRTGSISGRRGAATPAAELDGGLRSPPACLHQRLDTLEEANFLLVLQIIQHFLQREQQGRGPGVTRETPTLVALLLVPALGYLLHLGVASIEDGDAQLQGGGHHGTCLSWREWRPGKRWSTRLWGLHPPEGSSPRDGRAAGGAVCQAR